MVEVTHTYSRTIVAQFREIQVRVGHTNAAMVASISLGVSGQVGLLAKCEGGSRSRHPVWVIACLPRSPPLLQVIRRDVEIMRRIIVVSH